MCVKDVGDDGWEASVLHCPTGYLSEPTYTGQETPCGLTQECALMLLPLFLLQRGEGLEGVWAEDS